VETRRLGKTEHLSSVVTFGTFAFGMVPQDEADRAIEYALARGVNHFDVAPTYAEAEQRLGDYLKRHPQPDLFVGCKTEERGREGAHAFLHRTLERLGRDRFDLYQVHAVGDLAELDRVFAPGGAFEAILQAKEEGLVEHIGITGHGMQAPATHAEALRRYPFSTVMVAVNPLLHAIPDFRRDWDALVAACRADDVGIHVLKATAKAPWGDRPHTHTTWYEPLTDQGEIDRAVAWALNQPVATICSAGDLTVFPKILDAAERYREIPPAALQNLHSALPDTGNIFEEPAA
jgi:aryl-alcohol dehydrogenase-like predicted oxidoreductase